MGDLSANEVVSAHASATLVDSCVLIDVLADDAQWADWSLDQLDKLSAAGPLVINPLILAELAARYERAADLEAALAGLPLVVPPRTADAIALLVHCAEEMAHLARFLPGLARDEA